MTDAELIGAWRRWDAKPRGDDSAPALVVAIHEWTDDTLEFRRFMSAGRRDGLTYQRILDLWRQHEAD